MRKLARALMLCVAAVPLAYAGGQGGAYSLGGFGAGVSTGHFGSGRSFGSFGGGHSSRSFGSGRFSGGQPAGGFGGGRAVGRAGGGPSVGNFASGHSVGSFSDQPSVGGSAAGRSFGRPSFGRPSDGRLGRSVGAESSVGDLEVGRSVGGFSTERPIRRFNGEPAVGTLGAERSLRSSALEESPGRPSGRRISADAVAPHPAGPSIGDAPAEQPGTRSTIYRWVDGKGTLHFSDRRRGEGQAAGAEVLAHDSPVLTSTTLPRRNVTSPGERDAQRGSHVTNGPGAAHPGGSRTIDGGATSGPHIGNAGWGHGFRHHRHHNAHRRPVELLVFAPFYPFLNFGYPYGYYPYPYTFDAYDGYGDYCDPNSPAYDPSRLGTYGDELICCSPYSPYYDSDHCVNADES